MIKTSNMLRDVQNEGSVSAMLGVLKLADEEAYRHSLAVAELVDKCITLQIGNGDNEWTSKQCLHILEGALLHDIGKAFLPFNLQHSARKLEPNELEIIKMHPLLGSVAVQNCNFDDIVINIILAHHANLDGSGYPVLGNKVFDGKNVPDYVWLVAYADRFEAMTNIRSFKNSLSYPEAWKKLVDMTRDGKLPYRFTTAFGEVIKSECLLAMGCGIGGDSNE